MELSRAEYSIPGRTLVFAVPELRDYSELKLNTQDTVASDDQEE